MNGSNLIRLGEVLKCPVEELAQFSNIDKFEFRLLFACASLRIGTADHVAEVRRLLSRYPTFTNKMLRDGLIRRVIERDGGTLILDQIELSSAGADQLLFASARRRRYAVLRVVYDLTDLSASLEVSKVEARQRLACREGEFKMDVAFLCDNGYLVTDVNNNLEQLKLTARGMSCVEGTNSNLELIMGDKFENIQNSTIVNRSQVSASFNALKAKGKDEIAVAMEHLATVVEQSKNSEAADNYNAMAEEMAKASPKKSVLKSLWDGLISALPAVSQMTDLVAKISSFWQS